MLSCNTSRGIKIGWAGLPRWVSPFQLSAPSQGGALFIASVKAAALKVEEAAYVAARPV